MILSYNADPWMQGVAAAATLESIPWIPLVLDCFNPLDDDWRRFTRDTSLALGVAFISHWAFEHAPVARKHLLAGAVVPRRLPPTASRGEEHPLLLYAGRRFGSAYRRPTATEDQGGTTRNHRAGQGP